VPAEEFLRAAISVYAGLLTSGQLGVLCGRKTRGGSFNTARKQILAGYAQESRLRSCITQPTCLFVLSLVGMFNSLH